MSRRGGVVVSGDKSTARRFGVARLPGAAIMVTGSGTGFVLRTWPLRESDLIASVFTAEEGKIRGVAHRATRPKSRWSGALEALTEIGLDWRAREDQELVTLTDASIVCTPYVPQPGLGATWSMAFVAELVDACTGLHDPDEVLYRLLRGCVSAWRDGTDPVAVARYAQCWLLRLAGVLPELLSCAACGEDLGTEGGAWHWSLHGIGCANCLAQAQAEGPSLFPADFEWILATRHVSPAKLGAPNERRVLRRTGVFLGHLTRDFLGKELKSERFLNELEKLE